MNHLNTTQAIENQLLSITKMFGYEYEFAHNKYNYSLVDGKMYREGKNDDYFEMKVNEVDNCVNLIDINGKTHRISMRTINRWIRVINRFALYLLPMINEETIDLLAQNDDDAYNEVSNLIYNQYNYLAYGTRQMIMDYICYYIEQ